MLFRSFFAAVSSRSDSTGNGSSSDFACSGVTLPTATTLTFESLRSLKLSASSPSWPRQVGQCFPRKKTSSTRRPPLLKSESSTSLPSGSFSVKSGAFSPTATDGVPLRLP